MAHITGGGLAENVARVIPAHVCAEIVLSAWELPPVFQWLAENGPVEQNEMLRVFNCGIGYVMTVPEDAVSDALQCAAAAGIGAQVIGKILPRGPEGQAVQMQA